jgi:hypothetical protein
MATLTYSWTTLLALYHARHRLFLASITAVDATCRPTNKNDTLHQDDTLHLGKTPVDSTPTERFLVLGWVIDLRWLRILLLQDKLNAWTYGINDILSSPKPTKGRLDTLVGRPQHASWAIPMEVYFLQ